MLVFDAGTDETDGCLPVGGRWESGTFCFVLFCLHTLHFSSSKFTIRDILGRQWRYVAFA